MAARRGAGYLSDMQGHVAIVTGGARGIGREAVLEFAQRGCAVAIVDLAVELAEDLARELRQAGRQALALRANVAVEEDARGMVAQTLDAFGQLDYAFNNAGILGPLGTPLHELSESQWDEMLDVNLKSMFLCMKHEIVAMLPRRRGAIVNTSSLVGLRAATFNPAYGASKHGVVGLTRAAASFYGEHGLRVNAICPGIVQTDMTRGAQAEGQAAQRIARTPLRRGGDPREIARTAVWLCSDEASFISGAALPVDGGISVVA